MMDERIWRIDRTNLDSDNEKLNENLQGHLDVLFSYGVFRRVEPDKVVTTRYENMFGPCDFIDRIDVAEPGTYAIIRIGDTDGSD